MIKGEPHGDVAWGLSPTSGIDRERFLSLAFCWAELLLEIDHDNRVTGIDGASELLLGRIPQELLGRDAESLIADEDMPVFHAALDTARQQGRSGDAAVRFAGAKGPTARIAFAAYHFEAESRKSLLVFRRYRPMHVGDATAAIPRDADTRLYDAETFPAAAAERIARHSGQSPLRMTLVALNGYAAVQTGLGPDAEQQLLQQVGACLRTNSLASDTAGRISSQRFAFVHDARQTIALVEKRIQKLLRDAAPLSAACSLEMASVDIDDAGMSAENVRYGLKYAINRFKHRAGAAVRVEDGAGSSGARTQTPPAAVESFTARRPWTGADVSPGMSGHEATRLSEQARASLTATRQMQDIITGSQFEAAFQPIIDTVTGEIHHYEALARFPTGAGSASAYEHITFAEESGLIGAFDLAMAHKVIDWLSRLDDPEGVTVAINVSGLSVGSLSYLDCLDGMLAANPWLRGRLMFEITESARMERLGPANAFIRRLRQHGFPVCLDDFGAGAANFRYLSRLEVDIVKLDGYSLHNAQRERTGEAFLKALVGLCDDLGIVTVAEMIENEAGLAFVRDCGVHYVQGHLLGRPAAGISHFAGSIPRHLF